VTDDATSIDTVGAAARLLYGLEPTEFVAARNRLVKALKADGKREMAAEVSGFRRPTVVAAELNRVLRADPETLEALLEAANALRDGQRRALADRSVDVAGLRHLHREMAGRLTADAGQRRERVRSLLEATSLDAALHEALRGAAFAVEPQPRTGFDVLDDDASTATVSSLAEARARRRAMAHGEGTRADGPPTGSLGSHGEAETDGGQGVESTARSREAATGEAPTEVGRRAPPGPRLSPAKARAELDAATKAVTLAQRRVGAAVKTAETARRRMEAAEARLATARGNLAEAETRVEAAEDAQRRARQRLAEARDAHDAVTER
jgi:hypothetical protein